MWDVKELGERVIIRDKDSFTLTMWDVKSKRMFKRKRKYFCFTLTMWDVKLMNEIFGEENFRVLP